MRKTLRLLAPLLLLLWLTGCASLPEDPDREQLWTPSDLAWSLGAADDPCEGWNRAMFETNAAIFRFGVRPLGWIWGSIFPKVVIEALNHCADNLAAPGRIVSCLLQAKWSGGGMEFARFLTNSTLGIAGLWDPAEVWFEWYPRRDNFGQAFASWGIGAGPYFLLPLMRGTNPRDLTGELFDMAFDLKSWIPYAGYVVGINRGVSEYKNFIQLYQANYDPYELYKLYTLINRNLQLRDWPYQQLELAKAARARGPLPAPPLIPPPPPPANLSGRWLSISEYSPAGPFQDTLRVAMCNMLSDDISIWTYLSPFNTDFTSLCRNGAIDPGRPGAEELQFRFWPAADEDPAAPLAVLLPGTGSHHTNAQMAAMAEMLRDAGYSVVVLDSALAWSFQRSGYGPLLPGYVPEDARALNRVIDRTLAVLREKYEQNPQRRVLIGYSLGALHALHIAGSVPGDARFDRIVAVNPPVDLFYALRQVDGLLTVSRDWDRETVEEVTTTGFAHFMTAGVRAPGQHADGPTPALRAITAEQAQFLIGMSFRLTLRELLAIAQHEAKNLPGLPEYRWSDRTALYRAADRLSFEQYVSSCLLPDRQSRDQKMTLERLKADSSLRAVADKLRGDPRIRILHNYDDFLLSGEDRAWLDRTFGPQLTWFSCGGHLGNLYSSVFQKALLEQLTPAEDLKSGEVGIY